MLSFAPFYRSLDPRVIARTDKYSAVSLAIISNARDNDLSAYVHCRATRWYRLFPPVGSPDRTNEKDLHSRVKEGADSAEGQEGADAEVLANRAVKISNDDMDATP